MIKMTQVKNKQDKLLKKNQEKEYESDSIVESIQEDQLRADDLENAERVKVSQKIKGTKRLTQTAERNPKEAVTKFDRHTFDPGFLQMITKEVTYKQLRDELKKYGIISDLVAEVNAGKEATILVAHLRGAPLIVKAFRLQNTCHSRAKGNPQMRAASIAQAEYDRLTRAFNAGMRVPTAARKINNVIIMSFIGNDWEPAPQLRNAVIEEPEEVFDEIIEQLRSMYRKAKLIHGDFSEYNILLHEGKPVIIDFPQAIDISLVTARYTHIRKRNLQILQKDIETIGRFFEKEYNLTYDFDEVYRYIAGNDIDSERVDYSIEEIEKMIGLKSGQPKFRDKAISSDSYQH
jgi:RIO kinase 1